MAVTYAFLGRTSLAEPLVEQAFALDPLSTVFHAVRGFVLMADARFEEATPHYARWRQLDAENPFARLCLTLVHIFNGRFELAQSEAAGLAELAPDSLPARLGLFLSYGLRADASRAKAAVTADVIDAANAPDAQVTFILAWGYGLAGEYELALEWLERAVVIGVLTSVFWRSLPFLRPLFDDPRFQALMERLDRRAHAFGSRVAVPSQ